MEAGQLRATQLTYQGNHQDDELKEIREQDMEPLEIVVNVVKGIIDLFYSDHPVTAEELKEALDDAVEAIKADTRRTIELHELQMAQDSLQNAMALLAIAKGVVDAKGEQSLHYLEDAEKATREACYKLDGDIDLISDVGGKYDPVTGSGLLGHHHFLIAVSLWAAAIQGLIRFHKEAGSSTEAEFWRTYLRDICIQPSIDIAETMQREWVVWTRDRRFSPLEMRTKLVGNPTGGFPFLVIRFRWRYWFDGAKKIVGEHIFSSVSKGEVFDDPEKAKAIAIAALEQAAIEAEAKRLADIDEEVERVRDGRVKPSQQVVEEWRKLLEEWNMMLVPREVLHSFEQAIDTAANVHHNLISDAVRKAMIMRTKPDPLYSAHR